MSEETKLKPCPLIVLSDWQYSYRGNSVEISHDNGYGAHPGWYVKLTGRRGHVELFESELMDFEDENSDWPGLGAVILEAVKRQKDL